MARKADDSYDSCCGSGVSHHKVIGWVLVILGLLGVLQAVGYVSLPSIFAWVWALFVLIIGVKKVFWSDCCQ